MSVNVDQTQSSGEHRMPYENSGGTQTGLPWPYKCHAQVYSMSHKHLRRRAGTGSGSGTLGAAYGFFRVISEEYP